MFVTKNIRDMRNLSGLIKGDFQHIEYSNSSRIILGFNYDVLDNFTNTFDCHIEDADMNGSFNSEVLNLIQEVLHLRLNECTNQVWFKNSMKTDKGKNTCSYDQNFHLQGEFDSLFATKATRLALMYKSSSFPTEKDLFVRNMTGNMWLYLAGVLILLALCLRLSTHTHHSLKPRHSDWSWPEVVQWTLGAVCQQGSAKHPQGCSCRTMFIIGYLITYMIYTGYAAGITSLLAVRAGTEQLPWNKAISSDLPFTTLCKSDGEIYLNNRDLNDQGGTVAKCVNTVDQLVAEVMDSEAIAVVKEDTLQRYLTNCVSSEERCRMSVTKQTHHSFYNGFFIRRNHSLKQQLNYWLLRFKEHGLLSKLQSNSEQFSTCEMPPGYTEVGFEHVKSAFLILFLYMIVAVFIFILESLLGTKAND